MTTPWLALLLLCLLLGLLARGVWLWTELFRLAAARGKLTLRRGRIPPALFAELSEIAEREHLDSVVIRAFVEGGAARLVVQGKSARSVEQPMRNVIGRFPLPQLRSGKLRAR
jgi:hypothetical protein